MPACYRCAATPSTPLTGHLPIASTAGSTAIVLALAHGGRYIPAIMSDPAQHFDQIRNIWAPWRLEYIESLHDDAVTGCFLCRHRDEPQRDRENLVLWRGDRMLAMLNRFPYTGGHALVAPRDHVANLGDLDGPAMQEMMEMLRDLQIVLAESIGAQGFNVGINLGHCAGAGLPGHLHAHIVPRWSGDTNFMSVFDNVRVIPTSLRSLYDVLSDADERLGLPKLSAAPGGGRPE